MKTMSSLIYAVFSTVMKQMVAARRWIARIMITWGILSVLMAASRGVWSLLTLRLLFGIAEGI